MIGPLTGEIGRVKNQKNQMFLKKAGNQLCLCDTDRVTITETETDTNKDTDTAALFLGMSSSLLPVCTTEERKTHRYCSKTEYLSC